MSVKIIRLYEGTSSGVKHHDIPVESKLIPEIKRTLQRMFYDNKGYAPRGTLCIESKEGILFKMPVERLCPLYTVREK